MNKLWIIKLNIMRIWTLAGKNNEVKGDDYVAIKIYKVDKRGYEFPFWWRSGKVGEEGGLHIPQASHEQHLLSKAAQAHKTYKNITHCMWRKQQCELQVNGTFYISLHNLPTHSHPWHSSALTVWTLGDLTVVRFIVKSVVIGWHS